MGSHLCACNSDIFCLLQTGRVRKKETLPASFQAPVGLSPIKGKDQKPLIDIVFN